MTPAETQYRRPRGPLRISLTLALALGFGGLVFAAVGGALGIGLWSARENTLALLAGQADAAIGTVVRVVRDHLDPVETAVTDLRDMVAEGTLDPADREGLVAHMRGTMAAMPQVFGMGFVSPDSRIFRVPRDRRNARPDLIDASASGVVRRVLAEARRRPRPYWGELIWGEPVNAALINLRAPLRRDGKFLGVLTAVVSVEALSRHLATADLEHDLTDRFVLFGRNHVLAHRGMAGGSYVRSPEHPIPTLSELDDPVLSRLWQKSATRPLGLALSGGTRGHVIETNGQSYPVLYREVRGYGPETLIVGAYIQPESGRRDELRRLAVSAALGIGLWVIAVIGALVLGRHLSGPVRRLAEAARATGRLDLDSVPRLRGSRLRELDEAVTAFNAMSTGLRWFETYVPRRLVYRLMARESEAAVPFELRDVTVMFTDITGFSTMAERLGADQTAELLNAHFSLLAGCIEGLEGTVDKYIGDSVMAFWGAPDDDPQHTLHACDAALAIARAIRGDNEARRGNGAAPISVRIGIHRGSAIAGNIGAPGRINYTLVGDTVNIAQRLEELAKEYVNGNTTIAVSNSVADAIAGTAIEIALTSRGHRTLRGHDREIEVFTLEVE